jgi:hypothetical protein
MDARRTEKREFLNTRLVGLVDDVSLDDQVVLDELSRIDVVYVDPAHLVGGQDHLVGPFRLH